MMTLFKKEKTMQGFLKHFAKLLERYNVAFIHRLDIINEKPVNYIDIYKREGGKNYHPVSKITMPFAFDARDVQNPEDKIQVL